jgi:outer membrane protein
MKTKSALLLLTLLAIAGPLFAQSPLKVGFIDPQEVLVRMPEYAAADQALRNFAERKREEFARLQADFEKRVSEFEQKIPVLSPDAKAKEEEQIEGMRQILVNFQSKYQEDLMKEQQTRMSPLIDKIKEAIKVVANDNGFTYVINPRTSSGDLVLLYVSDEAGRALNLTKAVIDKLGL